MDKMLKKFTKKFFFAMKTLNFRYFVKKKGYSRL